MAAWGGVSTILPTCCSAAGRIPENPGRDVNWGARMPWQSPMPPPSRWGLCSRFWRTEPVCVLSGWIDDWYVDVSFPHAAEVDGGIDLPGPVPPSDPHARTASQDRYHCQHPHCLAQSYPA